MKWILFFLSFSVYASLPENDIVVNTKFKSVQTQEYLNTIRTFESYWGKFLSRHYNKTIKINKIDENTVRAYATRDFSDNLEIYISKGMLSYQFMNPRLLNMILCHELGHYIGGAPKSFRGKTKRRGWSSAEGQADYFSTSKCIPKMFNDGILTLMDIHSTKSCDTLICHNMHKLSFDISVFYASLKTGSVNISKELRDSFVVRKTIYTHPRPQCRFDTLLSGAQCSFKYNESFDDSDAFIGSCMDDFVKVNDRPECWFSKSFY